MKVKPDRVVFGVGVITRSADLMEAKKKSFDAVKKAIEYCKKAGIAEKNIKTDYINIQPEWKNYEKLESTYVVEQNLSIILDDVSKYEEMITELLKTGMNNVGYVDFQTTELKKYKNESRKLAIEAAKERAEFLAGETGITLGKIINISDASISWFPFAHYVAEVRGALSVRSHRGLDRPAQVSLRYCLYGRLSEKGQRLGCHASDHHQE